MTDENHLLQCVVVGCLVRNDEGKVLLIRNHKRSWEIPQGRVELGENLVDALHREIGEEAGIGIEKGPLVAVWSKVTAPAALIFTFLARYTSGDLSPTGDSAEACWLTEEEALERVTNPVMHDRLKALLDFQGIPVYRAYSTKPYRVEMETDLVGWPQAPF